MFTAKSRGGYRDFHIPLAPSHVVFHIINNCHHSGIHINTDEYVLTHHCHLESIVCGRLLLVLCILHLDKCVMICIHSYSSRIVLTVLKSSRLFHPFLLPNPWQTLLLLLLLFYYICSVAFPRYHNVGIIQSVVFLFF